MPDSYTNLIYHIVFSTKNRLPFITSEHEPRLYDYIGGTIRGLGGISLGLNGTEDHVHVLAKLRPDRAFQLLFISEYARPRSHTARLGPLDHTSPRAMRCDRFGPHVP